jgi:DNA-binding NtrC family response regulator
MSEFDKLLGRSEAMRAVKSIIAQAAPTDISVLIVGESGTGKERVARALHEKSRRSNGPLVIVNCGAIPQGIFESEVFGHERGSFTGAERQRRGYFEQANGGTIFLDEIGDIPLEAQVKLLRVLEQREFMRVGSSKAQKVDVRVIAATNSDLSLAVSHGDFRQDLYFRLKAVTIHVPPLRERAEDVLPLAEHFAREFASRNQMNVPRISPDAVQLLRDQYWAGNVRELKNTVETVLTLERDKTVLGAEEFRRHLPPVVNPGYLPIKLTRPAEALDQELMLQTLLDLRREVREVRTMLLNALSQAQSSQEPLPSTRLEDLERDQILRVLEENGGNRRKTARVLGIGERTLYRKLKDYDIA